MSRYTRKAEINRIIHEWKMAGGTCEWPLPLQAMWWRKRLEAFGKKERNEVHRQNIAQTLDDLGVKHDEP